MTKKSIIKQVSKDPIEVKIGNQYFLLGYDFLGINRQIIDATSFKNKLFRQHVISTKTNRYMITASYHRKENPLSKKWTIHSIDNYGYQESASYNQTENGIKEYDWPFLILDQDYIFAAKVTNSTWKIIRYEYAKVARGLFREPTRIFRGRREFLWFYMTSRPEALQLIYHNYCSHMWMPSWERGKKKLNIEYCPGSQAYVLEVRKLNKTIKILPIELI